MLVSLFHFFSLSLLPFSPFPSLSFHHFLSVSRFLSPNIVVANGKAVGYCKSHFPLCTHTCIRFRRSPVYVNSAVVFAMLRNFCSQVRFRQKTEIYRFGTHYISFSCSFPHPPLCLSSVFSLHYSHIFLLPLRLSLFLSFSLSLPLSLPLSLSISLSSLYTSLPGVGS